MTTRSWPHAEALAEDALLLRFGDVIDASINAQVQAASHLLKTGLPAVECVPAYASLLIRFDPLHWCTESSLSAHEHLSQVVFDLLRNAPSVTEAPRDIVIPVLYGGDAGPDLAEVAAHARLTANEVIARHAGASYRVAMLGFAPGFPYLLGLDPSLAVPRRPDPRLHVPAGSVAIGGSQTGIYPADLPGGWHVIGRTPCTLFDPGAMPATLLQPGDRVRFRAVHADEYASLAAAS